MSHSTIFCLIFHPVTLPINMTEPFWTDYDESQGSLFETRLVHQTETAHPGTHNVTASFWTDFVELLNALWKEAACKFD